jgi:hypothetical protein
MIRFFMKRPGIEMVLAVIDIFFVDKKTFSKVSLCLLECQRNCVYRARIQIQLYPDPLKLMGTEEFSKFGSHLFDQVLNMSNFLFKTT